MDFKFCSNCKQNLHFSNFALNKAKPSGHQTHCRICKSQYDKKYYQLNKSTQKDRIKIYVLQNKRKVFDYLEDHPCIDCGESNPVVLDFDHRDSNNKRENISSLVRSHRCSWKTIYEEILKCDVRCANCHRIRTANQFKWSQLEFKH